MMARIRGWCFVVFAVGAFGGHLGTHGASIGEIWAGMDRNSLVGFQALIEKRLDPNPEDPTVYFDYVLPVLEIPFWMGLAIIALVLAAVSFVYAWLRIKDRGRQKFLE